MITVKTAYEEIVLKPTIFPDGTSQIWKINPVETLYNREYHITWNFESEREIYDLYAFKALLAQPPELVFMSLHIPYMPFARQDKSVNNDSTFNLAVFAQLLNGLNFNEVTSVDVHNPIKTAELINNFSNVSPIPAQQLAVIDFSQTFIVYPDKGAKDRYTRKDFSNGYDNLNILSHFNTIFCDKVRDSSTGNLSGLKINLPEGRACVVTSGTRFLIVDDICDGGATFIAVSNALREHYRMASLHIGLFVTHGIFSKGKQHLLDNGIDKIYTTNSLPRNEEGYKV